MRSTSFLEDKWNKNDDCGAGFRPASFIGQTGSLHHNSRCVLVHFRENRRMFIDETQIKVKAGDGGDGAVAFLRLKFMPWGGPAGGDGGKGGDIVFEATRNIDTLLPLYRRRRIAASDGANGSNKNCSGRGGEDVIIQVPPGTIIRDANSKD